jgi:hypothetical protein
MDGNGARSCYCWRQDVLERHATGALNRYFGRQDVGFLVGEVALLSAIFFPLVPNEEDEAMSLAYTGNDTADADRMQLQRLLVALGAWDRALAPG